MELKYIVTGTGRCGTVFMARLLTSLGIPCGHESVFTKFGLVHALDILRGDAKLELSYCSTHDVRTDVELDPWLKTDPVADSSYLAAPYLDREEISDIPVIQVVRNPIMVVSSFVIDLPYFSNHEENPNDLWQKFIYTHVPELDELTNPVTKACLYYVRWNQMIEKQATFFHRVENGVTTKLADFLDVGITADVFDNRRINSWKKGSRLTFGDIPRGKIRDAFLEMSIRYGYKPLII